MTTGQILEKVTAHVQVATLHARVQGEGEHGPKAATTQLLIVTTWEAGSLWSNIPTFQRLPI